MGLSYGWVAPTLRLLQDDPTPQLPITVEQAAWIGSLHEFGRFVGSLASTSLLGRIGRKYVLATASAMFFVTFAMIAFTRSVPVICASRWLFGVGVGVHDVASTIYLCENFKPTYRGVLGGVGVACFYGGTFIEFCWVNYLTYDTVAYTNAVFSLLALFSIFASTETPPYLITKQKYEKALKNFLWLRGKKDTSVEVITEFAKLREHIDEERKGKRTFMAFLKNSIYRKTIVIVLLFCLLTNSTGMSPVESFASIAFTEGVLTPNEYTILFGGLQFIAAVAGTTIIEKVNRRTILICTLLIAVAVHACTAALFYLQNVIHIPYFSWLVFATITLYAMVYAFGTLPIFYTLRGELLPQNVRSLGGAIAILAHSLIGFVTAEVFLLVAEKFGIYWNFVFYSIMSLVSVLFIYYILPETKGKSLMEIQTTIEMRSRPKSIPD